MTATGTPAPDLGPFLKKSAGLHAVVLAGAAWAMGTVGKPPAPVYRIDFIGATDVIMNRNAEPAKPATAPAAPTAPAKPERQKDPDAFNLKPSYLPLPRPSLLEAAKPEKRRAPAAAKPAPAQPAAAQPSFAPAPAKGGDAAGAGVGSVSADMPDFPYPWYLTSLRQKLWAQWSARMPAGEAEAMVMFSVMRDGSIVDLRIEATSGERAFDYAAMSAVRATAPLPPLPPAFKERFLTIHVQFKATR